MLLEPVAAGPLFPPEDSLRPLLLPVINSVFPVQAVQDYPRDRELTPASYLGNEKGTEASNFESDAHSRIRRGG